MRSKVYAQRNILLLVDLQYFLKTLLETRTITYVQRVLFSLLGFLSLKSVLITALP